MKIKELLSDKNRWTQRAAARDINGLPVDPLSDNAVSFCLIGALRRCYKNYNDISAIRMEIAAKVGCIVVSFNDDSTYEQVMEVVNELDI